MTDIFKTLAKLREVYPEDIARIDEEAKKVKELMAKKEFSLNSTVKELATICRKDILWARKRLATEKELLGDIEKQRELWFLIESREWFLQNAIKDYDEELASIESQLENEL